MYSTKNSFLLFWTNSLVIYSKLDFFFKCLQYCFWIVDVLKHDLIGFNAKTNFFALATLVIAITILYDIGSSITRATLILYFRRSNVYWYKHLNLRTKSNILHFSTKRLRVSMPLSKSHPCSIM